MLINTQNDAITDAGIQSGRLLTTRRLKGHEVEEISLEQLNAADKIKIRTANSTYYFVVTDPQERYGMLVGGIYRNEIVPAVLVGAGPDTGLPEDLDDRKLLRGARALFFTGTHRNPGRLVTSEILGLSYLKGELGRASG